MVSFRVIPVNQTKSILPSEVAGISSRYNQRGEQLHGVRLGPSRACTWRLRGGVKSAAHSRYQRGRGDEPCLSNSAFLQEALES